MKRILCSLMVCLLAMTCSVAAQVRDAFLLDNVAASGVQQMFYKNRVLKVGNDTYICGATINSSGDYDILLSKFDGTADTLIWSVSYDGSYNGNDYAADLAVDGSNNIFVVGTKQVGALDYDAVALKYNSSGVLQWASAYAGAANGPDGFTSVILNGTDIYAAGGAVMNVVNMTDVLCVKYNSSGTQQWYSTWNNNVYDLQDAASRLIMKSTAVRVMGATQVGTSPVSWRVVQLDIVLSTGSIGGNGIGIGLSDADFTDVKDVAVDDNDNIYVCGTRLIGGQQKNIHVAKYNNNLAEVWNYTKNGTASTDDEGVGIELSGTNVFISGYTSITSQGRNVYAAKLAQSNGAVSWEINNNLAGGDDEATGLQMDGNNNLIIPCVVDRNSTKDIGLLKLDHSTGAVITSFFYNSETNRDDFARDIAVNHTNNDVYVSAQVQVNDSTYESRIIKWKQKKVYSPVPTDAYSSYGGYIPNNTQLRETDSTANRTVRFYNQANAIATYIDDSKISYQLVLANDTADADTTYRVDMALIGGKPNAKVYPYHERSEYINYYLGHMDKPSIRTPLSNVVLKQDVYTNTDVLFTSSPTGFRHWFIARTGATPSSYEMSFTGQTGLSVDSLGNLVIATTIGDITYQQAKAYSMNTSTGALTLLGWQPDYSISGSTVSFTSIGAWSGVLVLEVDEKEAVMMPPYNCHETGNLNWSTYFYGQNPASRAYCFDIQTDEVGNFYSAGRAGGLNFPIVAGANQVDAIYQQGEGYVSKFNVDVSLVWSTFIGGNRDDDTRAIALNDEANGFKLYAAGRTCSLNNFAWASPDVNDFRMGHNNTENWIYDAWITRLDHNTGVASWGTYISSNNQDEAIDLLELPNGEMLLTGNTKATTFSSYGCDTNPVDNKFPLCAENGEYLDNANSDGWDLFIIKFNSENELIWSTLYGGDGHQLVFETVRDNQSPANIWLVGRGGMMSYQDGAPNSFLASGSSGGFIVKFNSEGTRKWATHIPGVDGLQTIAIVRPVEQNARLIVAGYTPYSTNTTNSCSAVANTVSICTANNSLGYHDDVSENGDVYIAQFNQNTNQLMWSTLYGDDAFECEENIYRTNMDNGVPLEHDYRKFMDIAWDTRGFFYISGASSQIGYSSLTFPLDEQPDWFFQDYCATGGIDGDAFIIAFDMHMRLFWSTFFEGYFNAGDITSMHYFSSCISQLAVVGTDYLYFGGTNPNEWTPLACPNTDNPFCQPGHSGVDPEPIIGRFDISNYPVLTVAENNGNKPTINLYPVPATDHLMIGSLAISKAQIKVFDGLGRVVMNLSNQNLAGGLQLDIKELSEGMYIVELLDEQNISLGKAQFIKAK